MSYQRDQYRRALRAAIQRESGQFRGGTAATQAELRRLGLDTELFNEPEDLSDTAEIQGPGGGFVFLLGFSELGGPDPLG